MSNMVIAKPPITRGVVEEDSSGLLAGDGVESEGVGAGAGARARAGAGTGPQLPGILPSRAFVCM